MISACAFWMIFGGDRIAYEDRFIENANATVTVNGFQTFNAMLFTLFRLTLVDEYQYDVSNTCLIHCYNPIACAVSCDGHGYSSPCPIQDHNPSYLLYLLKVPGVA